jgi:hypothetical protein
MISLYSNYYFLGSHFLRPSSGKFDFVFRIIVLCQALAVIRPQPHLWHKAVTGLIEGHIGYYFHEEIL